MIPPTVEPFLRVAELSAPDATIPVPARVLVDLRDALAHPESDSALEFLTVVELASLLKVAASTVRGWCAAGKVSGARHLGRLGWRVPRSAVPDLVQQLEPVADDLSAWRRRARRDRNAG